MAFHVPELSRGGPMTHPALHGERSDGNNGAFDVESPEPGWRLAMVASDGEGWEHVSIHRTCCICGGRPPRQYLNRRQSLSAQRILCASSRGWARCQPFKTPLSYWI